MMKSKLARLPIIGLAAAVTLSAWASDTQETYSTPWTALESADEVQTVTRKLDEFRRMSPEEIRELDTIPAKLLEMPEAGVDIMRARVTETYTVDGVGTDTVELIGWIAVRHGSPHLAEGETVLSWDTAVVDTEFIAMDLRGESALFGPIRVALDSQRPSWGHVGKIKDAACHTFANKGEIK